MRVTDEREIPVSLAICTVSARSVLLTEDEVIDSVDILLRPRRLRSFAAWLTAGRASFLQFLPGFENIVIFSKISKISDICDIFNIFDIYPIFIFLQDICYKTDNNNTIIIQLFYHAPPKGKFTVHKKLRK